MAMGGISAGVAGASVRGGAALGKGMAFVLRDKGVGTRLLLGTASSASVGVSTEKLGPLLTAAAEAARAVAAPVQ